MSVDEQLRADLRAVKEDLLEHGWLHGGLGSDDGPRCIVGAVNRVTTGTVGYCRALDEQLNRREGCVFALKRAQVLRNWGALSAWNDADERTFDEVIALVDRALASLPAEISNPTPVAV